MLHAEDDERGAPPLAPETSPDPDMNGSDALPTSFNRRFDAIVSELIREHRRVVARGRLARQTGQLPTEGCDCGAESEPTTVYELAPHGLGCRSEGPQAEGVAVSQTPTGIGGESCIDTPSRQGGEVNPEQASTPGQVWIKPAEVSREPRWSAELGEGSRTARTWPLIRLRSSDSDFYNRCLVWGEAKRRAFASSTRPERYSSTGVNVSTMRRLVQRVVLHPYFEPCIGLVILMNALIVGYEIQVASVELDNDPGKFVASAQTAFNCVFLLEWCCRVAVEGWDFFWVSKDALLNWFDTTVILCSVVLEVSARLSQPALSAHWSPTSVRIAKTYRLMRLLRASRISRIFSSVNALRVLVHSVLSTMRSLAWAMVLLVAIFYLFAATLTLSATEYRIESSDQDMVDEATTHWGSLTVSMFTLFMSISGGVSWIEALAPLRAIGWWCVSVFTVFISITSFAALNVLTGAFCQTAHETALEDQHDRIRSLERSKRNLIKKMQELMETCDEHHSGFMSLSELEAHMEDEYVRDCFLSLGIEVSAAFEVFRLLDADRNGGVDPSELIAGAMKMRGQARSIDVVQVQHDVKMLRYDIRLIAKGLNEYLLHSRSGGRKS